MINIGTTSNPNRITEQDYSVRILTAGESVKSIVDNTDSDKVVTLRDGRKYTVDASGSVTRHHKYINGILTLPK
jgi:hypothetical protein